MQETSASEPAFSVTEDRLMAGRVRLRQPRPGYRAGADAALLAAAGEAGPGERVIEAGCGAGAALLQGAARWTGARFVGLERDPSALGLAMENIALNDMTGRVDALGGDVAAGFAVLGLARFDAAMANPPFFDDPASLRAPHPARAGAYMADDGLEAWTRFLLASVRDGGRITLVHRADRLGDILGLLSGGGGGSLRIRPVQPFADTPAKRVLVRAVRGGRAPLALLPPLVLHNRRSAAKHTPEAEAILRGEAALGWD
ncbi:MAG TPA: methyltransferase [Caulobacteraceae bacterium]|jgi:tRNA1(Val) A37 N6-methylase TrmN6|nr:methyltransferase [Caulobacteraceae bacterium]